MARSGRRRPSVLFVVIDCLRADHCSVYGYGRPTTPTLERLAQEGVVYEQAISPAGWSLPSHASLFTGLYPSKHGADDQHQFLDADVPTLAELLAGAGYRTLGFCGNPWVSDATGLTRGFQVYDSLISVSPRSVSPAKRALRRAVRKAVVLATGGKVRRADWAVIRTRRWIERLARADEPFFMFLHYNEPHTPHQLPLADRMRFARGRFGEDEVRRTGQDVNAIIAGATSWTERDYERYAAIYDGGIAYADERLGRIVDTLRATGQLDDTIVVVTADHGEALGEHGLLGHKVNLYDTLVHVPLVVRYPAAFAPGERVGRLVQTLDIAPTVLDLAGVERPAGRFTIQGRSLLGGDGPHPFAISEQAVPRFDMFKGPYPYFDPTPYARQLEAIRTDRWKYIWASDQRDELYDLAADPGEQRNLVAARPDVAGELRGQLFAWLESFAPAERVGQASFDDAVTERLRALGYIP